MLLNSSLHIKTLVHKLSVIDLVSGTEEIYTLDTSKGS